MWPFEPVKFDQLPQQCQSLLCVWRVAVPKGWSQGMLNAHNSSYLQEQVVGAWHHSNSAPKLYTTRQPIYWDAFIMQHSWYVKLCINLRAFYSTLRWNQLWIFIFEGLVRLRIQFTKFSRIVLSSFCTWCCNTDCNWLLENTWEEELCCGPVHVWQFSCTLTLSYLQQPNSFESSVVRAFTNRSRYMLCPAQWTMFSLNLS